MAVGQFLRCGEPLNTTANYWESQVPGVCSNLKDVRYTIEQSASNKNCRLYYDLWGVCSHLLWCVYFIYTCICICLNTHTHTHIYIIYTYTSYTHIYIRISPDTYIYISIRDNVQYIYIYYILLYYVMLCYTHIWSHMYIILCIRLIKVLLGYLWPRYATFAFGPQLSSTPRRDHWMGLREHLNGKPWFLPWKRGFSLDWFKGKSTGNPIFAGKNQGFLYKFPLNQSIDTWERKFEEAYPGYLSHHQLTPSVLRGSTPLFCRVDTIVLPGSGASGPERGWCKHLMIFASYHILPSGKQAI